MTLTEATIIPSNVDDASAAAAESGADDDTADDDNGDEVEVQVSDLGRGHNHTF